MIEMSEIRGQIHDAVSELRRVDERLAELAESLPLPPDAEEMWDLQIPMSFTANLYAALGAVRSDCIQDAVATLRYAVGQTDASLRHEWRSFRKAAYPSSDNNTPGDGAGRKETPQC